MEKYVQPWMNPVHLSMALLGAENFICKATPTT